MSEQARLNSKKEIRYLNRDFSGFKKALIDFSKVYYPSSYNDFNETSPGMMFIEMASYVGDVLSFYVDRQYKETLLKYAEDRKNVIALAENFGYKVKTSSPSNTTLEVFCVVPSDNSDTNNPVPDYRYAPIIPMGFACTATQGNVRFRAVEDVNFQEDSVFNPRTATIYEKTGALPSKWLLKKFVRVESTEEKVTQITFSGPAVKFDKKVLSNPNISD